MSWSQEVPMCTGDLFWYVQATQREKDEKCGNEKVAKLERQLAQVKTLKETLEQERKAAVANKEQAKVYVHDTILYVCLHVLCVYVNMYAGHVQHLYEIQHVIEML